MQKLGVKSTIFHDGDKWVGGCKKGPRKVIWHSKHFQGMYFHLNQPICSYFTWLRKNRFLKIWLFFGLWVIFSCILLYFCMKSAYLSLKCYFWKQLSMLIKKMICTWLQDKFWVSKHGFFGGHQFGQHLLTKCCLNVENCHTCIGRTIIGEFD